MLWDFIFTQTHSILPFSNTADSALKSFLSGGVGGICTVIVGHPFDLIKVKMQTGGASASSSVFGLFRQTLAKEGLFGLYRGVSAPLIAISPIFAVSFWGYDMGKRVVEKTDFSYKNDAPYKFTIPQLCVAGGISAFPTTLIMAPSERLKVLLQTNPGKFTGLWDCAQHVYKEGGVQSIFRGTGATLMRDVPGSIAWFGTYELVKKGLMKIQNIDPESGTLSPFAVLCAGGFAGMACWAVSIPADVLKSRFQSAPAGTYKGIFDVYRKLMKEEGASALFQGLRPAMVRAFPANAACFLGMEVSKKAFAFMD